MELTNEIKSKLQEVATNEVNALLGRVPIYSFLKTKDYVWARKFLENIRGTGLVEVAYSIVKFVAAEILTCTVKIESVGVWETKERIDGWEFEMNTGIIPDSMIKSAIK